MAEPDLLELFARPLHGAGIRYLVAGSLGAMLYSEPRLTLDVDLAVALDSGQIAVIPQFFPAPHFYCPPDEVLVAENKRECRGHFNVIHISTGLKADFYPSQRDPFFSWAWNEKREVPHAGGSIFYAPAEYVIVWKVAYFSEGGGEKHARDVRRMIEISGESIRQALLETELARRELLKAYRRMLHTQ